MSYADTLAAITENKVDTLYLDDDSLSTEKQVTTIISNLGKNTTLTSVHFTIRKTDPTVIARIARSVLQLRITKLDIDITFENVDFDTKKNAVANAIALELQTNSSLKEIRFVSSAISTEGAEAIAAALKINTTLESMILIYTQIGDKGAMALAEALKINKTLTHFCVRIDSFGFTGMQAIAMALCHNTTLESLCLEGKSTISDKESNEIIEILRENTTITTISLYLSLSQEFTMSRDTLQQRNEAYRDLNKKIGNLIAHADQSTIIHKEIYLGIVVGLSIMARGIMLDAQSKQYPTNNPLYKKLLSQNAALDSILAQHRNRYFPHLPQTATRTVLSNLRPEERELSVAPPAKRTKLS